MTRFVVALVALAALAMGPTAAVEADASVSQPTFVVDVRGVPMSCTSFAGEPVAIILNEQLGDVGMVSSASSRLAKTGPFRTWNFALLMS